MKSSDSRLPYNIIGLFGLLLLAGSHPFAKRCAEEVGSFTTIAIQEFVSGILGIILFRSTGKFKKLTFLRNKEFYLRTLLFGAYFGLFYFAIGLVDRENLPFVTLLNYLWPTVTMLLSIHFFSQSYRFFLLMIGTLLVIAGISIEILGEHFSSFFHESYRLKNIIAYLAVTLAAVIWGFYTVLNRKWGERAGGIGALPYVLLLTSFLLFPFRFLFHEQSFFPSEILLPFSYFCILPLIFNICWDIGTRKGNIGLLSLFADALPWTSLTVTQWYLGVSIGGNTWVSAGLIVMGAMLSRYAIRT